MRNARVQPMYVRPSYLDWDEVGNWIWHLRKEARLQAREELRQLKEK